METESLGNESLRAREELGCHLGVLSPNPRVPFGSPLSAAVDGARIRA